MSQETQVMTRLAEVLAHGLAQINEDVRFAGSHADWIDAVNGCTVLLVHMLVGKRPPLTTLRTVLRRLEEEGFFYDPEGATHEGFSYLLETTFYRDISGEQAPIGDA